jgi:hypothetical protein
LQPPAAGGGERSEPPLTSTDRNIAALAGRVRRAMSSGEAVRVRRHDGTVRTDRVARLTPDGATRAGTTRVIELDGGERVHLADVASIGPANRHARRRQRRGPRPAACAHAFGYRGHCLTESRRYSTAFKQLPVDREAFVHAQVLARSRHATQRAIAGAAERIATWTFDAVGHVTTADAHLGRIA